MSRVILWKSYYCFVDGMLCYWADILGRILLTTKFKLCFWAFLNFCSPCHKSSLILLMVSQSKQQLYLQNIIVRLTKPQQFCLVIWTRHKNIEKNQKLLHLQLAQASASKKERCRQSEESLTSLFLLTTVTNKLLQQVSKSIKFWSYFTDNFPCLYTFSFSRKFRTL